MIASSYHSSSRQLSLSVFIALAACLVGCPLASSTSMPIPIPSRSRSDHEDTDNPFAITNDAMLHPNYPSLLRSISQEESLAKADNVAESGRQEINEADDISARYQPELWDLFEQIGEDCKDDFPTTLFDHVALSRSLHFSPGLLSQRIGCLSQVVRLCQGAFTYQAQGSQSQIDRWFINGLSFDFGKDASLLSLINFYDVLIGCSARVSSLKIDASSLSADQVTVIMKKVQSQSFLNLRSFMLIVRDKSVFQAAYPDISSILSRPFIDTVDISLFDSSSPAELSPAQSRHFLSPVIRSLQSRGIRFSQYGRSVLRIGAKIDDLMISPAQDVVIDNINSLQSFGVSMDSSLLLDSTRYYNDALSILLGAENLRQFTFQATGRYAHTLSTLRMFSSVMSLLPQKQHLTRLVFYGKLDYDHILSSINALPQLKSLTLTLSNPYFLFRRGVELNKNLKCLNLQTTDIRTFSNTHSQLDHAELFSLLSQYRNLQVIQLDGMLYKREAVSSNALQLSAKWSKAVPVGKLFDACQLDGPYTSSLSL